jgi:hypothetical protein
LSKTLAHHYTDAKQPYTDPTIIAHRPGVKA